MLRAYAFVLAVTDLDSSAAYYGDVLGFRILWEDASDWRLAERRRAPHARSLPEQQACDGDFSTRLVCLSGNRGR